MLPPYSTEFARVCSLPLRGIFFRHINLESEVSNHRHFLDILAVLRGVCYGVSPSLVVPLALSWLDDPGCILCIVIRYLSTCFATEIEWRRNWGEPWGTVKSHAVDVLFSSQQMQPSRTLVWPFMSSQWVSSLAYLSQKCDLSGIFNKIKTNASYADHVWILLMSLVYSKDCNAVQWRPEGAYRCFYAANWIYKKVLAWVSVASNYSRFFRKNINTSCSVALLPSSTRFC